MVNVKQTIITALFAIFIAVAAVYSASISQNFTFQYGGGEVGSIPNVTHNAIFNAPVANDGVKQVNKTFSTTEKSFFDEFIGLFTLKDPDPLVKSENWLFYPWSGLIGGYAITIEPQTESFYEGDTSLSRTVPYALNLAVSGNSVENAVQLPELAVQDSLNPNGALKTLIIPLNSYPEIKLSGLAFAWQSQHEDGGNYPFTGAGGLANINSTTDSTACGSWGRGNINYHCITVHIEGLTYQNKEVSIRYRFNGFAQFEGGANYIRFWVPAGFYVAIPPPPEPPTLSLSASSATINNGQSLVLSWSSVNTTNCSASGGWLGGKSLSGSETVSPTQNTTYGLSCSGPGGSISREQTVQVRQVPSANIKANGSDGPVPLNFNESATISWASSNVNSCLVSPTGWTGTSGSQSTGNLTAGGAKTYSISCSGALGSASDSVIVDAANPTLSASLLANPLPPPGTASSYTTTLTANTGGTAIGTINYSLWWNCNNSTASVSTASSACGALPAATVGNCSENSNGVKCEAVNSPSLSRPHTFTCSAGGGTCNFRPKVITERMGLSATNAFSAGVGGGAGTGTGSAGGGGEGGVGAGTGNGSEVGALSPLITILPPPPYFTLSKSGNLEAGVSVNPLANSNKIQLTINPFNLFDANVGLSVESGMPAGSTAHFGTSGASTANLSAPYPKSIDFWLTIPRATAVGGHSIKIRGTGGGVSDTIDVPLNVFERQPEFSEI